MEALLMCLMLMWLLLRAGRLCVKKVSRAGMCSLAGMRWAGDQFANLRDMK